MIVDCAVYQDGRRRPGELALEDTYEQCRRNGAFAWIGLYEPSLDEFDSVRREFDLHELAVEDAVKAHQRPKLEAYGDSLFLVLKTARWIERDESVELGEILLFVGDGFIVSVRHGETALHDVRLGMERRPELLRHGPSAALHAIVDRVVDDYQPVIDGLEQAIDDVERQVFSPARANPAERIYKLKREVLELHRALAPLVEPMESLAGGADALVDDEMRTYFRDVHDHVLRMVGEAQQFREVLTSVLTASLTQASLRQNDDVRKISAWAAIIAVPTLVTGIYGMNFEHMPELGWTFGYPLALAAMLLVCLVLYRSFRRAGWL
jgi:magnesium transporter